MSYCQSQSLRPKTMDSYEKALRMFEQYLIDFHNVKAADEVKEGHIKEYIKYLSERGKYTVVANEQTRNANFPQNMSDLNKPVSEIKINNVSVKPIGTYLSV